MSDITGKRVLITGAGRGLGRQFAVDFAAAGARVAVNYSRSAAAAEEVVAAAAAAGGEAFCVGCGSSKPRTPQLPWLSSHRALSE